MDYALLILGIVNGLLFAYIGGRSWLLSRRVPAPRARKQGHLLTLVCAAFVVSNILRVGLQLVDVGALPDEARGAVLGTVQLLTSLGALVIVIPALWILRRLTAVFARSDRFVTILTERVRLDASISEAGLTAREVEVLELVADGVISDVDLAESLYISPSTAATHVRNIMKKTGVRRRHELMLLAPDRVIGAAE